jgi:hypothetical protein
MTNKTKAAFAAAGLAASMIAQAQQNPQPPSAPPQAAIAACEEDAAKTKSPNVAQKETGRVGNRMFAKVLNKVAPTMARSSHGGIQPSDIAQAGAETEAQKAREKQEHAKYCAALKEAAKKASLPLPTTKVIEACPPNTSKAAGTPYCLKSDNTLVDVLHITVPINPPVSAPASLTPAPPAPVAPTLAQH